MDGVVDWCIVLVEMPLIRFEECWPLPKESPSWNSLKPQHSNPNPSPLAKQLWCIYFLTPPTPLIIPHRLAAFLESLMPLKNWFSIHSRRSKSSLKHSIGFCDIFFPGLNRILLHILLKCQIAFLKFTGCDNCCCSCSFEPEIIKIGLTSHKIYSNNIVKFQDSTTILNACTKNVWKLIECTTYI